MFRLSMLSRQLIISHANTTHLRLFGHPMSGEMRTFLGHLSWSFVGGVIASIIMFSLSMIAGRILGPSEFGRYNALLSAGSFLSAFFLLGMSVASVRYLADQEYHNQQRAIFSTAFWSVTFAGATITLAIAMFRSQLAALLGITEIFLIWTCIVALVLAYKSLFNGFLRAFQHIKLQSLLRIGESLLVAVTFTAAAILLQHIDFTSYIGAVAAGGLLFTVGSLLVLRQHFGWFAPTLYAHMFQGYIRFLLIGTVLESIRTLDRFLMGQLLGFHEVGIYSAYYVASHTVVDEIGLLFLNVFWPSAIKHMGSMRSILHKIDRIFIWLAPVWIGLTIITTATFIWLLGSQYSLSPLYLVLFGANAYIGFVYLLHTNLLYINHVSRAIFLNGIFFVFPIVLLILSRNVTIYITSQLTLQLVLITYTRMFLAKKKE